MTDDLSATFAALADPTRRAILERLSRGEATIGELAEPFDLSLPAVSRHITVLEQAGLVIKHRHAQQRSCRIEPARLRDAEDWIGRYRSFFEERFDRLGRQLAGLTASDRPLADPMNQKETRS
ncbi:ArsR/SmtB family transcription factor [Micromonospora sp. DT81.3]|uniref:ArsR/SmtB family transcription factor n=1 Tax=Actinomycetes TaxID=1760 RepID=UPI003CEC3F73